MSKKKLGKIVLLTAVMPALLALSAACTGREAPKAPTEKVFRFGVEAKITTLDPHFSQDVYSAMSSALVYESLYHYHYLKHPTELIPVLAESLPKYSDDRKTLTIKIRKGVRFHDDACFAGGKGREVNAADVVYSLHRIGAPGKLAHAYGTFENNVVGFADYHNRKTARISGVRAVDERTVELRLTRPLPRFVYYLTDIQTAIMARECVEKYGEQIAQHPVGTGAFKITEASLGHRIVAVRNPAYKHITYPTDGSDADRTAGRLEDAGRGLPLIDKVILEVLTEEQPRFLKFLNGEFEMTGVPRDNLARAIPQGKLADSLLERGVRLTRHPRSDVVALVFNMEDPVWGKHKELRQAIAIAINRAQLAEMQYGGQAVPANSLVDPNMWGFDPSYRSRWADRDLAKARALLAKAGFPGGKGLPVILKPGSAGTIARQFDEILARQLAEIGITMKSDPMTWPEFDKRMRTKNFSMLSIGYSTNIPDIDDGTNILKSSNAAPGPNIANYRNPKVDKLVEEIEGMDNSPRRLAKIRQLNDILDEDLPYVPLVHRIANQLSQPWFKNHVFVEQGYLGQFMKFFRIETSNGSSKEEK